MAYSSKPERSAPVSQDAMRMGSYSYRAPSPPTINVPSLQQTLLSPGGEAATKLVPSFDYIDSSQLSRHDFDIITRQRVQTVRDRTEGWLYENRRRAQPILDFLYLGPTSIIRDHDFLLRESITMILIARDARMATARLFSVDNAAATLGIAAHYVDIEPSNGLVRAYAEATRLINHHLLAVHHAQAARQGHEQIGKVLVACETGNSRSAAVVIAYIMAMYGKNVVPIIQFTQRQRFCCSLDSEIKRSLQTWEDLMRARRAVSQAPEVHSHSMDLDFGSAPIVQSAGAKRGIDSTEDAMDVEDHTMVDDLERFANRQSFAPFRDL
ncbi:hypothetical protein HIM_06145 [Hirsutella minnesotensis 3608]|uniref:Tyrosine specific protein phosphatases domain-containing protein n=1 Tax=Hirsutella minnesotensis 3608 TaxID=1043627 RepID=A0A0F8A517_9HYPO|nr:hypothetical protein HIM_06145 [Hirsutella minnesotensis 3608]